MPYLHPGGSQDRRHLSEHNAVHERAASSNAGRVDLLAEAAIFAAPDCAASAESGSAGCAGTHRAAPTLELLPEVRSALPAAFAFIFRIECEFARLTQTPQ